MADKTLDTRNGGREQAAAEASPAAPTAKAGALSNPWLPLIMTVVLMPALAFATTRFFLLPQMKKAMAPAVLAAAPVEAPTGTNADLGPSVIDGKPKVSVPLTKILVNVAGTMGTRYLMTSVTLVGTDENLQNKIEQNKDQLLDLATGTLSTKSISDLEKPGSRNVIRAELMTVFNNALGGPFIKEIYITEMAIQ
jgi:flagellar FliL protein